MADIFLRSKSAKKSFWGLWDLQATGGSRLCHAESSGCRVHERPCICARSWRLLGWDHQTWWLWWRSHSIFLLSRVRLLVGQSMPVSSEGRACRYSNQRTSRKSRFRPQFTLGGEIWHAWAFHTSLAYTVKPPVPSNLHWPGLVIWDH